MIAYLIFMSAAGFAAAPLPSHYRTLFCAMAIASYYAVFSSPYGALSSLSAFLGLLLSVSIIMAPTVTLSFARKQ